MAPKKEKIPPPGNRKDIHTNFLTRGKWKSAMLKTMLEVPGKNLSAVGTLSVGSFLVKSKTIVTVDFSHNHLGDAGAVNMAQILKQNNFIQNLNLACNEITDVGGIALASAFIPSTNPTGQPAQWNRSLYYLNLMGNELRNDAMLAFCNAVAAHKDFSRLDLTYNHIGATGCKALPRAMCRNNLCSIVLSANEVGDEGVRHICAAWRRLGTKGAQAYLDLFQNDVGKIGGDYIGELITNNDFVTDINLASNTVGPNGVGGMLSGVMNNPATHVLRAINLQDNMIEDEGATFIAKLIESNPPTLIKININQNKITDIGTAKIAEALKSNKFLQFLLMAENKVGQSAVNALLEVVCEENYNKVLKLVDVRGCGLTTEMIRELADTAHKDVRVDYGSNEAPMMWDEYLSRIGDFELKKAAEEESEKKKKGIKVKMGKKK